MERMAIIEDIATPFQRSQIPLGFAVTLVRFPSAHGGLVHKVKGEVAIGDRARVVFKEKSKRIGSIVDIEYFEKIT
jgi:uncharacterized OB-fold protein